MFGWLGYGRLEGLKMCVLVLKNCSSCVVFFIVSCEYECLCSELYSSRMCGGDWFDVRFSVGW